MVISLIDSNYVDKNLDDMKRFHQKPPMSKNSLKVKTLSFPEFTNDIHNIFNEFILAIWMFRINQMAKIIFLH